MRDWTRWGGLGWLCPCREGRLIGGLGSPCNVTPQRRLQGFYPSIRGAEALYLTLAGRENRWGKLPVTIYPAEYTSAMSLDEFDMTKAPGRTYRYYRGTYFLDLGFDF